MTTDTTARVPILPADVAGLRARAYAGPADHPAMAILMSETYRQDGVAERTVPAALDTWLASPRNLNPRTDIVLVEAADGRIVASAIVRWIDRNTTGERSFEGHCDVLPEFRHRGIGAALLAWQTSRVQELAGSMTDLGERATIMAGYIQEADGGGHVLLEKAGYRVVRRAAEMRRGDLDDIAEVHPPDGIDIRAIDPADENVLRRLWILGGEVFSDHWGDPLPDLSEASWRRFRDSPHTQPQHWCVAFADDEIVGHILSYLEPNDQGDIIGWTENIAVREPWRRRGVARAMLAWSLRRVRDAGAREAALGVDLDNPNQALALYESLGFRTSAIELEYHRPLHLGRA